MSYIYRPTSDGFPSDEGETALYSTNRVVGDILPQGADQPFQRLTGTNGGGWLTTNTDPTVVGLDPLTLEEAPVGTDVGFSAPVRRYIQTNVLNGDFSQGPTDTEMPISEDNPLPFWAMGTAVSPNNTITWEAYPTFATGYGVVGRGTVGGATTHLVQWVPVPMSQGQQWRALVSAYMNGGWSLRYQFFEIDGTTAIGSEVSAPTPLYSETKVDAGLVPSKAAYLKLTVSYTGTTIGRLGEVRAAFVPVEATVGLFALVGDGTYTTAEGVVGSITIQPNTLVVGSVYRIMGSGVITSTGTNVCTFRIRLGTTTLAGAVVAAPAPTATATASSSPFRFEGMLTVQTTGASGTAIGYLAVEGNATQPFSVKGAMNQPTSAVTVDTTTTNLLEVTAQTAGGTTEITVYQCAIQCVMAG